MKELNVLNRYILEIVLRIHTIKDKCKKLKSLEYISESPKHFLNTIYNATDFVEKAILNRYKDEVKYLKDEESKQSILKFLQKSDDFIQLLGSWIRFVEGSRIKNLPWSIIPAFESILENIMLKSEKVEILLRPQWKYNFSIYIKDFRERFKNRLIEYEEYVDDISIEKDVLQYMKNPFYLISFPSLEKTNILFHPLLGHEVGHLLVEKFLTEKKETKISLQFISEIEKIVENELTNISNDLFYDQIREQKISEYYQFIFTIWKRGLEELIPDMIAARLFGPSILFACYSFSAQMDLDHIPSEGNNFYPSWRLRLKFINEILLKDNINYFPIAEKFPNDLLKYSLKIDELYEHISKLILENDLVNIDFEKIKENEFLKNSLEIAYKNIILLKPEIVDFILDIDEINKFRLNENSISNIIPKLILRLEDDLPPNAVESKISDRKNASVSEIINAAWFFYIKTFDSIFDNNNILKEEMLEKNINLNNLVLKAIEYSELEKIYKKNFL